MFNALIPETYCHTCLANGNADAKIESGDLFCRVCGRSRGPNKYLQFKPWEILLSSAAFFSCIFIFCILSIIPGILFRRTASPTSIVANPRIIVTAAPMIEPTDTTEETGIMPIPSNPVLNQRAAYAVGDNQSANRSIYIKYLDGSKDDVRVTSGTDKYGDNFPSFSSDGNSLAFSRCFLQKSDGCELYVKNLASSDPKLILSGHKVMRPKWCSSSASPYRDWVVFEDRRKNGNNYQDTASSLGLANVTNREFKKLTSGVSDWFPNWSPDCSQIVFTRYADNDTAGLFADLMLLDLNTGSARPLVQLANFSSPAALSPAWSPDGQWIAFRRVMDTNGDGIYRAADDRNDLWLIHPDGSDEHAIISSSYSVSSISWSPNSQLIIFTTQDNRMLVCNLNGEIIFDFGGNYFHPDWAP